MKTVYVNNLNGYFRAVLIQYSWDLNEKDQNVLKLKFKLLDSPPDEDHIVTYTKQIFNEQQEDWVIADLKTLGFTGDDCDDLSELFEKPTIVNLKLITSNWKGKDYCNIKGIYAIKPKSPRKGANPLNGKWQQAKKNTQAKQDQLMTSKPKVINHNDVMENYEDTEVPF